MANNATQQQVSTLEKLNQISDDIHGYGSETEDQHRLKYNSASRELFQIMNDHRDQVHILSEEEYEVGQDAFSYVNEIKSKMRGLNTKAKNKDLPFVGEEVPEKYKRGFALAEKLIGQMKASPYQQKLARNAIFDAGCEKSRGQRTAMVVPKDHPAKVALWELYNKTAHDEDVIARNDIEEKQAAGTATEQEVLRLTVLNQAIANLADKL